MKFVLDKLIQEHKNQEIKATLTFFLYKSQQSEIISNFLNEMRKENPQLFKKKEMFIHLITRKYDDLLATMTENQTSTGHEIKKVPPQSRFNMEEGGLPMDWNP